MKRVKRLVSLMLSIAMIFAFSTTTFAADINNDSITDTEYLVGDGTISTL